MQTAQEVINALGAISKARFLVMNDTGFWYAYTTRPNNYYDGGYWCDADGDECCCISDIFNIQPAKNWKESLVEYQPNPEIKIQEYGKKI